MRFCMLMMSDLDPLSCCVSVAEDRRPANDTVWVMDGPGLGEATDSDNGLMPPPREGSAPLRMAHWSTSSTAAAL